MAKKLTKSQARRRLSEINSKATKLFLSDKIISMADMNAIMKITGAASRRLK